MKNPAQIESSFFLPFELLPGPRRDAFRTLYHYCRALDDSVDETAESNTVRANLLFWHGELDAMFDGTPAHPCTIALQPHIRAYNLSRSHFRDMLAGFEMDYSGIMRKPGLKVLDLYSYRVASTIGLLSCEILGCSTASRKFAIHLGKGMQLINILRDLDEDAQRNRIYLPHELLHRYGLTHISPDNLLAYGDPLREVCRAVADVALEHFAQAKMVLPPADRRKLIPALIMRDIYRLLLWKLERRNWIMPAEHKARVCKAEQWLAVIAGIRYAV